MTEAERANIKAHETLYGQQFGKEEHTVGELVKTKIAKVGIDDRIESF